MKIFAIFVLAMMVTLPAFAVSRDVEIEILAPATTVDGDALLPTDLDGYRLYAVADGSQVGADLSNNVVQTLVIDLPEGTHCFTLTALLGLEESDPSVQACGDWVLGKPGTPTILRFDLSSGGASP